MTLPEWRARSQRKLYRFFLVFDLIVFVLLFVLALLRTLGVLPGPAPGPVFWAAVLVGLAGSLYALYRFVKRAGSGSV